MPFENSISWSSSGAGRAWQGCAIDNNRVWLISDRITDTDPHVLSNNIERYDSFTGAREAVSTGVYTAKTPINNRDWCFVDGFYHNVDGYLYICCTDFHTNSSVETECQIVVLDPDNDYSVIKTYNLTSTRPSGDGSIESICWHEDGWFVSWTLTFNVLRYSNTQDISNEYFDSLIGSYEIPRPLGVVPVSPSSYTWQGIQFLGDTIFATLHGGNPVDEIDAAYITQARWSGFDFRPVAKHAPPSNGCGQGLAIDTSRHLFYFADRRNNALVRAQGVDLNLITNDSLASDGNMFISLGSPANLDDLHLSTMTISVDINPVSTGTGGTGRISEHRDATTGAGWLFFMDGTASLGWQTTTETNVVAQQQRGEVNQITLNEWQHVLLTFNYGGDQKAHIYVNGVEITYTTNTSGGTPGSNAAGNLFIRNAVALTRAFDGKMKNFAIWNSVLSESDRSLLAGGTHPRALVTAPLYVVLDITDADTESSASLSGTVYEKNLSGVFIPGAYPVRLYRRSDGALVGSTTSSADGSYLINNIPKIDFGGNPVEYYAIAIDVNNPLQSAAIHEGIIMS